MTDTLEAIDRPDARAVVAPAFAADLHAFGALDPDAWRAHFTGSPAGGAGRLATATARVDGRARLVLRRFHHGGALGRVLGPRLRSPHRLFDEFRAHCELAARGAPVPQPAFAVAHRAGGGWTGGIATVCVADAVDGLRFLAAQPTAGEVERCAEATGSALRGFHGAGGRHADLHVGNLLVRSTEPMTILVIDLDRARVGAPPPLGRRAREIARLERSLHKRGLRPEPVSAAACDRFLDAYVDGDRAARERLCKRLRLESLRTAIHRVSYAARARSAPHG